MLDKLYYTFENLKNDLIVIHKEIERSGFSVDVIIGPCRGAYVPGVMLSHLYNKPFEGFMWQTRDGTEKNTDMLENIVNKYKNKNILVIDDINDTGETLLGINSCIKKTTTNENIKYCVLFNKTQSNFKNIDYYVTGLSERNNQWIVFPYEEWFNR